jgi:hypothetical protein
MFISYGENYVMRLIKMVPVVGLCVASFLPASAAAGSYQQWQNDGSNLCLDATDTRENAFVQQSECNQPSHDGQKWKRSYGDQLTITNKWTQGCLDVYAKKGVSKLLNTVTTSPCRGLNNQKWKSYRKDHRKIQNVGTKQCLAAPLGLGEGPVKVVDCDADDSFKYLYWHSCDSCKE